MALANFAASVQGVALRLSRLDAAGRPMVGENAVYVTRAFMRVSFTPEYEEGDEFTEKNGAGEVCITFKAPDTLKRATMELAICEPDPEITELLTGGVLLAAPPDDPNFPDAVVGYASQRVGESPNPNGTAVEVWSLAVREGARDNDLPFFHWVFPRTFLRPSGDRVIENGVLANAFEGFGVGNANFGTGPVDDWAWPDATDRPFLYARDDDMPWNGSNGWYDNTGVAPVAGATRFDPPSSGTPNPEFGISETVPALYPAEDSA